MSPEHGPGGPFDESFRAMRFVQQELERMGHFFYPVPREHTEGGITDPLLHRVRTQIRKRGFATLAGRVSITFSGYAQDEREIFAVPEIRSFYQRLDAQLPELPALLAYVPQLGFNGPANHLLLLGTIERAIAHPELGGYHVAVADADRLRADALRRIRQAGQTYHLSPTLTNRLTDQFSAGIVHRIDPI